MLSQLEICLGCVLKALVAVEPQLRGGLLLFFTHCLADGAQNRIRRWLCCSLEGYNAVVIQIPDHGQVQYALPGVDAGDVRSPFAVGSVRVKVPVKQIFVLVDCRQQCLKVCVIPFSHHKTP